MNASSTAVEESSHDYVLQVRNVSATYQMDRGLSRVLNNVNLDVHRDEIIGIVGESGSGKSMFASSLLDAVPPPGRTTGEVIYNPKDGDPIDVLELPESDLKKFRWEEIAMVFQGAMSSFNPTMRIRGHFEETIEAHDMDMIEHMSHAYDLLEDLYLDAERVLDSYPHELSGGMKQRALLALSLVLDPEVLVMDEPTAALDLLMQRSIVNMLLDLRDEYDLTILFITHDLPLVAGLVDRLVVMYAFQFVEIGEKRSMLEDARHPYARALLKAVPSMQSKIDQMRPIEGKSPDPVNVPEGCPYHPRCPLADETCRQSDPDFFEVSDDQQVACYHWEDSAEAIPYELVDESMRGDGQ